MNKGFWMAKGAGHENDGDATYGNPSRIEPKRSHQWFADSTEPQLFRNKKQAVHVPNSNLSMGMPTETVSWENPSSFQSVPHQFIDRLFGSDTESAANFSNRNMAPVGSDDWSIRTKGVDDQFGEDAPVNLSISHAIENPEVCLGYAGIRKIKVNQVKDSDTGMHASREHGSSREYNSNLPTSQAFDRTHETSFISPGQAYDKEHDNVTLMGHTYNLGAAHVRPLGANYGKREENVISIGDSYSKGNANMISFGGFPDEQDMNTMDRAAANYDQLYHQSSVQTSETANEKESDATNVNAADNNASVAKSRPEPVSKSKPEIKPVKKQAPNSFPSNVRSLISTGILDGVPVKYVSLAREELRGIIKGASYLCGCQSCNFTKGLNAYEFERHAGCKTKHPNNHIYFENGKTIYQIVQELRSTPESLLFDTMQTVFGAPINQKSFLSWKESFQAATRELQRIYGKEELNL
ncbi:uncharacterized protein LOC126786008 [Argentina anserina]|uniref:uncharacterized protein LOC126786008 n=1 Tax=Argentina anserina TaxID=57926 RepID=UPI0021764B6F|nr:uncharacterized protein LOC126786008 [Potentilla anserina]